MFYEELTPAGICYTFNGIRSNMTAPIVKTTNVKYGLKLILNIEQETHPTFDDMTGVKVIIHERNDIPRPNLHGISVPPGQNVDIGVHRTVYVHDTDEFNCNKNPEGNFNFLPAGVIYSQYACRENKLYENLANENICGCVPNPNNRPKTGRYANTSYCTLSNLCCLMDQYSNYDSTSTNCRRPCSYIIYEYKNSYSIFPNGRALTKIARTVNMSEETVKKNFLSVRVFLEDLQTTESRTE